MREADTWTTDSVASAFMNVPELSEMARLAQRIRDGSTAGEEELVLRFQDRIYVLAEVRMRDPEAAHDLTQEVLMAVIRALRAGQLQDPERLAGYVLGVAHNLISNALRSRKEAVSPFDDRIPSPDAGPEEISSFSERRALALRAIARLGREDQRILFLSLVDGLSPREIAERLGLPSDVVRQRKSRALARARERLEKVSRS